MYVHCIAYKYIVLMTGGLPDAKLVILSNTLNFGCERSDLLFQFPDFFGIFQNLITKNF